MRPSRRTSTSSGSPSCPGRTCRWFPLVVDGLRAAGLTDVPVVVGGIIPDADARALRAGGVARVFTPRDFAIADVLGQVVDAIEEARGLT